MTKKTAVPASVPATTLTDAAAPIAMGPVHCPYRRTTDLLQRLAPSRMRVGFFLGAGCPLSVPGLDGKPIIPEVAGLTEIVKQYLEGDGSLRDIARSAWERVIARGVEHPTIEDVLGHIRTLKSVCGSGPIDGFSADQLVSLDSAICEKVREIVSQDLPESGTPYHVLASWIQAVQREKPVEIFTTNYDLLIEQALEAYRVPFFDGFIGADNAFLDLESMAEDDLPARWARLWKIHGSVNWWVNTKRKIRRSRDKQMGEQLLIYPSHLKYDQSRQMPYTAMLDRLRAFMRSGQCVLVTCGYSFSDEHINSSIVQGLVGNPDAACVALMFNDLTDTPRVVSLAKRHANLTVLAADGGIVGTIQRPWDIVVKDANPAYVIAVAKDVPPGRTKAPTEQCKWLLGDFAAFGRFLAQQLSNRDIETEPNDEA